MSRPAESIAYAQGGPAAASRFLRGAGTFRPQRASVIPVMMPDIEARRAAMKKLAFLAGKWAGEASVLRGPGQTAELSQTEQAQFRLDGLVLEIESVGRRKTLSLAKAQSS